jgi:hypothetical protein
MEPALDYEKLIHLDAEELAEGGIRDAYLRILPYLKHYVLETAEVVELANSSAQTYFVRCEDVEYRIYTPEMPSDEREIWGRATYALFNIVNDQLEKSEYRLFAINGGNDLGGMFLTQREAENARRSLSRKEDWPYLPTAEHPWYGQFHK